MVHLQIDVKFIIIFEKNEQIKKMSNNQCTKTQSVKLCVGHFHKSMLAQITFCRHSTTSRKADNCFFLNFFRRM